MLNGRMGKSVVVQGSTVKIIKKKWVLASQRDKTLPIRNISSVEVKKPGALIVGFIQFSIAGGIARDGSFTTTGGAFDAVQDENSVVFADNASYLVALKIKEYVETYTERRAPALASPPSIPDEIAKFKALMDQGVISADDFERKKRQLLDL